MNLLPCPTTLSTSMEPPWASTSLRAMVSPRPVPPVLRAREGSAPIEAVEDVRQVMGRNTGTGVGHHHLDGIDDSMGRHRHSAAPRRMSDGVLQQVADSLGDAGRIQVHRRPCGLHLKAEGHPSGLGAGTHCFESRLQHFPHLRRGQLQFQLAGVDLGQQTQVLDQHTTVGEPGYGWSLWIPEWVESTRPS